MNDQSWDAYSYSEEDGEVDTVKTQPILEMGKNYFSVNLVLNELIRIPTKDDSIPITMDSIMPLTESQILNQNMHIIINQILDILNQSTSKLAHVIVILAK